MLTGDVEQPQALESDMQVFETKPKPWISCDVGEGEA